MNEENSMKVYRYFTGKDDVHFCARVTRALNEGYELYGSPTMTFNGTDEGKPRTETLNGTYDRAGSALHMEMPVMEGKGRFVIWHDGPNLIMQQFGSRWTLARVKE